MAATTPIHLIPQVEYVAGRTFTLNGTKYESGDPIPADEVLAGGHVEALIRGRFALPVVDDPNDIPPLYWREIKHRDFVLKKLGKEDKRKKPEVKPAPKKGSKK
jgi:hypothetical protein